jgi:hypothetical protein
MKTCKDCIHQDVCEALHEEIMYMTGTFMGHSDNVDKDCRFFKDNTKLIELPCAIGDYCIWKDRLLYVNVIEWDGEEFVLWASDANKQPFSVEALANEVKFISREEAEKKLEELK